jgi:hypothetical protein
MVNKPRIKGTAEERRQRDLCTNAGLTVRRLAEEGSKDRGDFEIQIPLFGQIIVESKDRAQISLHQILAKTAEKAGGDAVVWWKRTELKDGNQRRSQVGGPLVAMPERLFLQMLVELAARGET